MNIQLIVDMVDFHWPDHKHEQQGQYAVLTYALQATA